MKTDYVKHAISPKEHLKAWNSTGKMLSLKWSLLNSNKARIIYLAAFLLAITSVAISSQVGQVLIQTASYQGDIAAKQMAYNYLMSYTRGEMGTLGTIAFSLAVYSSLIAPFTGVVSNSMFPVKHVSSLQMPLLSRFTDSFMNQMMSTISIFQLVALTTMASLSTLEESSTWALLFTWASWPLLISISVFASWGVDYIQKRFSVRQILALVLSVASVLAVVFIISPSSLGNLFGVGTLYTDAIKNINEYDLHHRLVAFGVLFGSMMVLILISSVMSLAALAKPEKALKLDSAGNPIKNKFSNVNLFTKRKHSPVYEVEMFILMVSQLLRSPDSIRPIFIAIVGGIPLILIFKAEQVVTITFIVSIPLLIACSWAVNFLGVLGGGLTWLQNQPRALNNLPWIAAATQMLMTLTLFTLIWSPAFIFGMVSPDKILSYILVAIATAVLITRSSMNKAIKSPYAITPGTKGEGIVPMGAMVPYTIKMSLWGCQYGVLLLYSESLLLQACMALLAVVWSTFRMTRLVSYWRKPENQSYAIQSLNQA